MHNLFSPQHSHKIRSLIITDKIKKCLSAFILYTPGVVLLEAQYIID